MFFLIVVVSLVMQSASVGSSRAAQPDPEYAQRLTDYMTWVQGRWSGTGIKDELKWATATGVLGESPALVNDILADPNIASRIEATDDKPNVITLGENLLRQQVVQSFFLLSPQSSFHPNTINLTTQANLLDQIQILAEDCQWQHAASPGAIWKLYDNRSDNMEILHRSFCTLGFQALKNDSAHASVCLGDEVDAASPCAVGHTANEHADRWSEFMKQTLAERARHGLSYEVNSPSYSAYWISSVRLLNAFSDDADLALSSEMFLDVLFTVIAQEQIELRPTGAGARFRHGLKRWLPEENRNGKILQLLLADNPDFESIDDDPTFSIATTAYLLDPIVESTFVSSVTEPYRSINRWPGPGSFAPDGAFELSPNESVVTYSQMGKSYSMSSVMAERFIEHKKGSRQGRLSHVIFRDDDRARVFPELELKPENKGFVEEFDAFVAVQNQNVMVLARRFNSDDDGNNACVNGMGINKCEDPDDGNLRRKSWIYVSSSINERNPQEIPSLGWIFLHEGGTYMAINLVDAGYSWIDGLGSEHNPCFTTIQNCTKIPPEEVRYIELEESSAYQPIIFEVMDSDRFNDFPDFKKEMKSRDVTYYPNDRVEYCGSPLSKRPDHDLYLEAERFTGLRENLPLQTGGSSLDDGYLISNVDSSGVGIGKLNHTFTVTRAGDYKFFFRSRFPGSATANIKIKIERVDDDPNDGIDDDVSKHNWVTVSGDNSWDWNDLLSSGSPVVESLVEGDYVIHFRFFDANIEVDSFLLQNTETQDSCTVYYLDNHVTAPHPVDFAPSKLFDGPHLQSLKGSGIITVTVTGTGSLDLDFSDINNPAKTVLP